MRVARFPVVLASALALAMPACTDRAFDGEGIPDVDPDVDAVPPGDAAGTDYSGLYYVRTQMISCTGVCESPGGDGSNLCADDGGEGEVVLTQIDGSLHVEVIDENGEYDGGINTDGSFDILSKWLDESGYGESTRIVGGIDGEGVMSAVAVIASQGPKNGVEIDCERTFDVDGERIK